MTSSDENEIERAEITRLWEAAKLSPREDRSDTMDLLLLRAKQLRIIAVEKARLALADDPEALAAFNKAVDIVERERAEIQAKSDALDRQIAELDLRIAEAGYSPAILVKRPN
jgi:Pyruvate/2-oxoacid:ferredoxin oxidoreductase gamma subunit